MVLGGIKKRIVELIREEPSGLSRSRLKAKFATKSAAVAIDELLEDGVIALGTSHKTRHGISHKLVLAK